LASRWSRFSSAVSRFIRSIGGGGRQERQPPSRGPVVPPRPPTPAPPRPGPSLPDRPPIGEPPGGPTMPPGGGQPPFGGAGGGTIGGGYDEPWFGNEITLYDAWGNPIPPGGGWTFNDWYGELMRTKSELVSRYGIGNIDLIYQLMALGQWDEEDWVRWREDYEEAYA
jgi:hypothetical protein